MKPNKTFELDVSDISLIESALHERIPNASMDEIERIRNLLGRLHNQKNWYRPKQGVYISG